jgi:hypothetical protein
MRMMGMTMADCPILTTFAQSDLILHYYIQLAEYLLCLCLLVSIHTLHPALRCHDSDLTFLLALTAIVSPLSSPSAIGGWTSTSVYHDEISCIVRVGNIIGRDGWAFGLELHGSRKAPQHRKEIGNITGWERYGRKSLILPSSFTTLA